jgi:neutral ceramidase
MDSLTAGVARADITPPLGFRMQGVMRRIEGAVGIDAPLLATVLVLADEQTKVVIADCDLIGFDLPLAQEIREIIGRRVNTPASRVLVGCTHTHNGPCTARGIIGGVHDVGGNPGERADLDAYITTLVNELSGLAALADSRRRPARLASGRGSAPVAINREERIEDGRIFLGRNPQGVVDHSVDVARLDDLDGNPIAVIASYACHPVSMGVNTLLYSPDFPGTVRRVVEAATGATCLYLTGAAGNQASISFLQPDWGEKERMGGIIGGEVVKTFYGLETRPHEVVREFGRSLSNLVLYHKEFHPGPTHQVFRTASRQAQVTLQPLPALPVAEAQWADARAALEKLEAAHAPSTEVYPARLVERWAHGVANKVKDGVTQEKLSFEIIGFRLDDFVLLSMPGEPFVEIGLGAKQRSKAGHTMFSGYGLGVLAYWPSPETVAQGGMAVEASVKTYNISAPPVSETVETLVGDFGRLLSDLDL